MRLLPLALLVVLLFSPLTLFATIPLTEVQTALNPLAQRVLELVPTIQNPAQKSSFIYQNRFLIGWCQPEELVILSADITDNWQKNNLQGQMLAFQLLFKQEQLKTIFAEKIPSEIFMPAISITGDFASRFDVDCSELYSGYLKEMYVDSTFHSYLALSMVPRSLNAAVALTNDVEEQGNRERIFAYIARKLPTDDVDGSKNLAAMCYGRQIRCLINAEAAIRLSANNPQAAREYFNQAVTHWRRMVCTDNQRSRETAMILKAAALVAPESAGELSQPLFVMCQFHSNWGFDGLTWYARCAPFAAQTIAQNLLKAPPPEGQSPLAPHERAMLVGIIAGVDPKLALEIGSDLVKDNYTQMIIRAALINLQNASTFMSAIKADESPWQVQGAASSVYSYDIQTALALADSIREPGAKNRTLMQLAYQVCRQTPELAFNLMERALPQLTPGDINNLGSIFFALAKADSEQAEKLLTLIPLDTTELGWAAAACGYAARLKAQNPQRAIALAEQASVVIEKIIPNNPGIIAETLPYLIMVDADYTERYFQLLPENFTTNTDAMMGLYSRVAEMTMQNFEILPENYDW